MGDDGDDDGNNQAQKDVDQWNQLVTQDDARRTMFLGTNFGGLAPVGNQLFYQDTTNYSPVLLRYDDTTGTTLTYGFGIGGGDDANFRASANLVVAADDSEDPVLYHAYDANSANSEVGNTGIEAPDGVKWDAYAVDGSTVYIVDTGTPGETNLLKWLPGSDPVMVTTLEQDGVDVGEFEDFDVSGNTMVFVASERVWSLDLTTLQATWLMNMTEAGGSVDFQSDGVMFDTADGGLHYYAYATGTLLDVAAAIDGAPFMINQTFAMASNYDSDANGGFARWGQYVLYIGEEGLFGYDLQGKKTTPIVLSPDLANLRIDYRFPVVLDNGTAFVTGLTSNDGAIGADGPTYKISLGPIF